MSLLLLLLLFNNASCNRRDDIYRLKRKQGNCRVTSDKIIPYFIKSFEFDLQSISTNVSFEVKTWLVEQTYLNYW